MDSIVIKTTGDGSKTLFHAKLNEHYHSIHGALTESRHVFIQHGLSLYYSSGMRNEISILEIGLGTGLNAALTMSKADELNTRVHYTALETHPVNSDILFQMEYDKILSTKEFEALTLIHSADWEKRVETAPFFSLLKLNIPVQDFDSKEHFDIIYFDAFAPEKQPEMWTEAIFKSCFDWLIPGGILVSYCAKGQFKRDLKSVGFDVKKYPGPPGKREITVAVKPIFSESPDTNTD